jgi:hypothetical protein
LQSYYGTVCTGMMETSCERVECVWSSVRVLVWRQTRKQKECLCCHLEAGSMRCVFTQIMCTEYDNPCGKLIINSSPLQEFSISGMYLLRFLSTGFFYRAGSCVSIRLSKWFHLCIMPCLYMIVSDSDTCSMMEDQHSLSSEDRLRCLPSLVSSQWRAVDHYHLALMSWMPGVIPPISHTFLWTY